MRMRYGGRGGYKAVKRFKRDSQYAGPSGPSGDSGGEGFFSWLFFGESFYEKLTGKVLSNGVSILLKIFVDMPLMGGALFLLIVMLKSCNP
jgi:hypothetical protein